MPAYVTNTIRDEFRQIFPDCTEADALAHLNAVRNEVLSYVPLVWDVYDVNLTSGIGTYSLEAGNVLRVWGAAYLTASNTGTMLQERQYYENIAQDALFETASTTDVPQQFYLKPGTSASSGLTLGLLPRPNATTTAGFPIVRLFVTNYQTLTAGTTFYEDIPNSEVYVHGMAARYAKRRRRQYVDLYENLYQQDLEQVIKFFREKQGGQYTARFLSASLGDK